jgi:hypothetical protein
MQQSDNSVPDRPRKHDRWWREAQKNARGSATKSELRIKRTRLLEVLRRCFALTELGERGTH